MTGSMWLTCRVMIAGGEWDARTTPGFSSPLLSPVNIRRIFSRIEKNHNLPPGTPGHGFNGYLDTVQANEAIWEDYVDLVSALRAVSEGLGQNGTEIVRNLAADVNFPGPARDYTQGVFGSTIHTDSDLRRFTSRKYILETVNAADQDGSPKYRLHLQLNSLATKVLFSHDRTEGKPRAVGVSYLHGANLYRADPLSSTTSSGTPRTAYARKEVILSGGAFNSPQLLQLSGIGPAAELRRFNISLVVDLPGVGANLQDNYELPIIGHAARDFRSTPPSPGSPICTSGAPNDPCVDLWEKGMPGPYSVFSPYNSILRRSAHSPDGERDFFMIGGTFALRGFWPPTSADNPVPKTPDPASMFGLSTVKIHPRSRNGTVRLRSADPRDAPEIRFHWFDGEETKLDLEAELDNVKWARRIFASVPPPLGPIAPVEPPCRGGKGVPDASGGCDDEEDKEWIMSQVFGHHPTCTCAIGGDDDQFAVLDSKFRVRGARGLRVVDASAFPRVPGAFPVIAIFLLSEKATESVLEDAGSWEILDGHRENTEGGVWAGA